MEVKLLPSSEIVCNDKKIIQQMEWYLLLMCPDSYMLNFHCASIKDVQTKLIIQYQVVFIHLKAYAILQTINGLKIQNKIPSPPIFVQQLKQKNLKCHHVPCFSIKYLDFPRYQLVLLPTLQMTETFIHFNSFLILLPEREVIYLQRSKTVK